MTLKKQDAGEPPLKVQIWLRPLPITSATLLFGCFGITMVKLRPDVGFQFGNYNALGSSYKYVKYILKRQRWNY